MPMTVGYERVSIGIDWLTVCALDQVSAGRLTVLAERFIRAEHQRGNLQRPWGMAGFSGWVCGEVQAGIRDQEAIVRLSGGLAHESWARVIDVAPNVTRIDLEVTFRCKDGPRKFIRNAHRSAQRYSKRLKRGPTVTLITDNRGGDTLYLGARTSHCYGRLYNKGVESGLPEYKDCARAECEYKGAAAIACAKALFRSTKTAARISGSLSGFFASRGVTLPIVDSRIIYRLPRTRSDLDRRLKWMRESVKHSVELLIAAGRENDVFEALGLPNQAN